MPKQCINCGAESPEGRLCQGCEESLAAMEALLEQGIVLEYSDGTKEILRETEIPETP